MSKRFFTILCVLISATGQARMKSYDLKMDLSINGKHISSPQVITEEGTTTSVVQNANGEVIYMDIVTSEKQVKDKSAIQMNFVVGTISAAGKKTVIATPKILAIENQKAEITVSGKQGKDSLGLSVIASRKKL